MATAEVHRGDVIVPHDPRVDRVRDERRGDLVRLGLATVLFCLTVLAVQRNHLSALERDVFRLINDLPGWLLAPLQVIMQVGTRFAPLVIGALVILVLRRVRLGVSIMVAGTGAWLASQLLKQLFERPRPAEFLTDLPRELSSGGPGFVSGHTAVATAMAAVTAPYLTRPWRRVVWALAFLVGFARIYSGVHLPLDVVGGFAIGWFVGTLVHMVIGTPRPQRTPEAVAALLRRLGLDVATVEPAGVYAKVSLPFRATTPTGERLFVKVLDPDPRSTDWVLRMLRVFATRERRDVTALASLAATADHEAAVSLAAGNAGVRVPRVVLARGNGSEAVVALEEVPGTDLASTPPEAFTDGVLERVWTQVAALHRALVAHRDLVRGNVLLDPAGRVWLTDFTEAQVGAASTAMDEDVAELLASLAVVVGPHRAVASAEHVLGRQAVVRAVPRLEPYALSPRTRRELKDRPGLLDGVRAAGGGGPAAAADLLTVHRVWLPAVVALAGYVVMLSVAGWAAIGDVLDSLLWRWVAVAGAVFAVLPLLFGYGLQLAAHRRLATGRSAAAGAVASTVEMIGGPAARRQHLVAYVRSCGATQEQSESAVDRVLAAELTGGIALLVAGVAVAWWQGVLDVSAGATVYVFLVTAAVAGTAGWLVHRTTRNKFYATSRRHALAAAWRATRAEPARNLAVLATIAAAEFAIVVALSSTLRAVESGEPVGVVLVAVGVARVLTGVLGLGGVPVVSEAVTAAVLCALGVTAAAAVVAVLAYAAFHYWAAGLVSLFSAPRLTSTRAV